MTENLRHIFARLFSLRAGMSLAAYEADAFKTVEEEYREADKDYLSTLDRLQEANRQMDNCISDINGEKYLLKKKYTRVCILCLIFLAFLGSGAAFISLEINKIAPYVFFFLALVLPAAIHFLIFARDKDYKKPNRKLIYDLKIECEKLHEDIVEYEKALLELYDDHEKYKIVFDQERKHHEENVRDIFNVLHDRYNDALEVEYWQYVDMMFYYFEAGKCDSMGSCIVLVQRLVQSEYLESSAKKATENLNVRCDKLIANARVYLARELDELGTELEDANSVFHGIVENNTLFADLKSKLAISSQTLYDEMMALVNL
jgi:hypothetical protein